MTRFLFYMPQPFRNKKAKRMLAILAQALLLTGAVAAAPARQDPFCDLFNEVVGWIQIAAGVLTVLAVLYLGGTKLAASIVPDIGLRTGTVVVGIVFGLVLVAFGQELAAAVIEAFGLPPVSC